jgi:hypothetical protein
MKTRPFTLPDLWVIEDQGEDGLAARSKDGLFVIASWGMGWDHVSVSRKNRCPDWAEMCRVKNLFWEPEEVVVQYHPRKSEYKNWHRFCLHLWKPQNQELPTPNPLMVAP